MLEFDLPLEARLDGLTLLVTGLLDERFASMDIAAIDDLIQRLTAPAAAAVRKAKSPEEVVRFAGASAALEALCHDAVKRRFR